MADIKAKGGEATAVTAEVSQEEECTALVAAARAAYGPIDILVNNAALNYYVPITDYATNRWIRAFAVNVHAPFMLSKAVLEDMVPRGTGAIVNISSGAAIGPGRGPYEDKKVRGGTMYGASKAALERFTQGLAQEMAQFGGIAVSAVSPWRAPPCCWPASRRTRSTAASATASRSWPSSAGSRRPSGAAWRRAAAAIPRSEPFRRGASAAMCAPTPPEPVDASARAVPAPASTGRTWIRPSG